MLILRRFSNTLSCFVLTIKGVECFAVSDDGQRVVVIEIVIKLVRIRVSGLRRAAPAVVRRVMLLTGVVCVTALRTERGGTGSRN